MTDVGSVTEARYIADHLAREEMVACLARAYCCPDAAIAGVCDNAAHCHAPIIYRREAQAGVRALERRFK